MRQSELTELWVIYDTQEECFIKFCTKAAWATSGAAKNAWGFHNYKWKENVKFNEQSRYVVMNIFHLAWWKQTFMGET